MKKIITIAIVALALVSCKKEELKPVEKKKYTIMFAPILSSHGYVSINGVNKTINTKYDVVAGDILRFVDTGDDVYHLEPDPSGTHPYQYGVGWKEEGYTNGAIIVDAGVVKQYSGQGDCNISYTLPK